MQHATPPYRQPGHLAPVLLLPHQIAGHDLVACCRVTVVLAAFVKMGGGGGSYHPSGHHTFKEVWSPSGGWWCDPKGWRRNTAFAVMGFLFVEYMMFQWSAENEKRYLPPKGWAPGLLYAKNMPVADDE